MLRPRFLFVNAFIFIINAFGSSQTQCDLEVHIRDGKWRSYDFVMNNCLVKGFVNDYHDEDLNFPDLLSELEGRIDDEIKIAELRSKSISQVVQHSNSTIKLQLELKTASRALTRKKAALEALQLEFAIQVTLLESSIRDFMERCVLLIKGLTRDKDCYEEKSGISLKVKQLCRQLRARNAFLLANTLTSKLMLDYDD